MAFLDDVMNGGQSPWQQSQPMPMMPLQYQQPQQYVPQMPQPAGPQGGQPQQDMMQAILASRQAPQLPPQQQQSLSDIMRNVQQMYQPNFGDVAQATIQSAIQRHPVAAQDIMSQRMTPQMGALKSMTDFNKAQADTDEAQARAQYYRAQSGGVFGGGPTQMGQPGQQLSLSGDEYLKTLNPQIANQVKAIAEGKMPFPSGMALKTPYWQQMMTAVSQYDPSFDAINYNARSKTYQDLTSGKTSQNVKSIETALNTLAQAQGASDKVGGVDNASIFNAPINWGNEQIMRAENDPNLNTYNNYAKAAADETTRAVIGAGGTGGDREMRMNAFRAGQSPAARNASLQSAANELASRLDPIVSMVNQGMGTNRNGIDLLSPAAQANYQKLLESVAPNSHVGNQATQSNQTPVVASTSDGWTIRKVSP